MDFFRDLYEFSSGLLSEWPLLGTVYVLLTLFLFAAGMGALFVCSYLALDRALRIERSVPARVLEKQHVRAHYERPHSWLASLLGVHLPDLFVPKGWYLMLHIRDAEGSWVSRVEVPECTFNRTQEGTIFTVEYTRGRLSGKVTVLNLYAAPDR